MRIGRHPIRKWQHRGRGGSHGVVERSEEYTWGILDKSRKNEVFVLVSSLE